MKKELRKDISRYGLSFGGVLKGLFTGHSFYAVLLYRLGNGVAKHRVKLLPDILKFIATRNFACEISPYATIGDGLLLHHTLGIVIGHEVIIGENVEIFQNVTIGSSRKERNGRMMPTIGNNVIIYSGAVVTGGISIGNNVVIGANSVVLNDIPDNSFVAGVPARVIKDIAIGEKHNE